MSQAMNQKSATKKKRRSSSRTPVVEAPPELTGAEKLFEKVKPHLSTITLAVVACLLGFIVIAFIMRNRFDQNALQWRELNNATAIAIRTGDVNGLKQVATNNPDTKAGLWALQIAGDQQLRMGLEQLSMDREGGLALVRKSKENFQSVVDAPNSTKTTMLQRRSHFSLAYASESLGQFSEAKTLYEQLVDEAPDSAFANAALRGASRCSNEDYAKLYERFESWEVDVIGDAPGPALPERPRIDDFPEVDLPPGQKPPAGNDAAPVDPAPEKADQPKAGPTGDEGPTGDASNANPEKAVGEQAAGEKPPATEPPATEPPPTEKSADKTDVEPPKTSGDDK